MLGTMWARSPEAFTGRRSAQPGVRVAVPAPTELRGALADPQRGHAAIPRNAERREPASMKHLFFSSTLGTWVTRAMPSSIVSGVRPRPRMVWVASSGRTLQNSSPRSTSTRRYAAAGRLAPLDRVVAGQVALAVVPVDSTRLVTAGEVQQRHRVVRRDQVTGHDEHERHPARGVLAGDLLGRGAQWLEPVTEVGLGQPGEPRVVVTDETVDLLLERGNGGTSGIFNAPRAAGVPQRPSARAGPASPEAQFAHHRARR